MKKIIVLNTAAQLAGRALSAVTTIIVTLLVARQFGATGYGDFVKVTTYAAFFYLITDFGINAIFLQRDERESWPSLVALRLVGSATLILISLIILALLPGTASQGYTPMVRLGILLFSPTILLQGFITTANAVFQKRMRYDFAARAIFFGSVVTIALLCWLVYGWQQVNILMVISAVAIGALVTATSSMIFASRLVGRTSAPPTVRSMKQLLIPSIPLGVTLLFNLVYFRADSVILTLTRPTAEVGVYGLAYKVFEVLIVFPTFFMNAVYPLLVKRDAQFKNILRQSFIFLLVASVLIVPAIWFAAPFFTLVKNDFVASIGALRVLALGLPLFFVSAVTMWGLIAVGKQKILAAIYGVSMAVNILGNIVLVPARGFMAAAWMTVVGEGLVLLLSSVVLFRVLQNNK